MTLRYELHCHSNVSDGAFPPAEVARLARAAGLDGIFLSDHDSTAGLAEARAEGARIGLEVFAACEVSTYWHGAPVHVLAYLIDPQHARFAEEMRWIREGRVMRAEKMVEKLRELGVPITIDRVRAIARGESIGRPHVAQALVEAGIVPTTPDAFTKEWIGDGGRAYIRKRVLEPVDTVRLIVEAGGVAVLAHPVWIERETDRKIEELIHPCLQAGLGGIEVAHPDHDETWRARYRAMADHHGLIKTGSSDYHGNAHGAKLGENACSEDVVAALRERAPGVKA